MYKYIKNKYWSDPVWSKVISAGIITVLGSIITAVYLLLKTLIEKISLKQAFNQLMSFFNESSSINNFLVCILILILLFATVVFAAKLITGIKRKKKAKLANKDEEELISVPYESTVFFSYRIASAFPGQRGLVWYNDPKIIVDRLSIVFQPPLKFRPDDRNGFSPDPIWWFRGTSSMYISYFEKLSKTKILLGAQELEIKRIAVNYDQLYYKCFIYIETKGEKQIGLYNINESDIARHIKTFGYSWEEFGLFNNTPIRREEYDDGAAIIKSKVVETFGAKLRIRFLTDYNFLVTAHDSPFNSDKFERTSEDYFNGILMNKIKPENFFEFLFTFKKHER